MCMNILNKLNFIINERVFLEKNENIENIISTINLKLTNIHFVQVKSKYSS